MVIKSLIAPHLFRSWHLLTGGAILGFVVVLLSLVQSFFAGHLIEVAQEGEPVTYPLIVVTAAAVLSAIVSGVQQFLLGTLTERSVSYWRQWFLRQFFFLPLLARQSRSSGWFSSRLVTDPPIIGGFVGTQAVQMLQSGVALVATLVFLLSIDSVSTIIPVLLAGLGVIAALLLAGPVGRMRSHIQEQNTLMSDLMDTVVSAARLLVASGADGAQSDRLLICVESARREGVRLNLVYSVLGPITSTLMQVAYASVFVVGGWRVASGIISFAEFITFLMLFATFQQSVQELASVPGSISECGSAVNHLDAVRHLGGDAREGVEIGNVDTMKVESASETHSLKANIRSAENELPGCSVRGEMPAAVSFSHVSFTYPGSDTPVLGDVSLTVPPQGLCVLVGPSGGGKSTCLGLVEGFFEADGGYVCVLGCSVTAATLLQVRNRVGYVDQDATLVSGTVLDNLAFGAQFFVDDDAMISALEEVGLWSLFSRNGGLQTPVGVGGLSLSGGQRQRLAIARALLRRPELLVLDEPTSNLDGMAEAKVRDLLKRISGTRAVLMTAHRLSTILEADHVIVLQGGRVVGEGGHEDLMGSCSYYRELVSCQIPSSLISIN